MRLLQRLLLAVTTLSSFATVADARPITTVGIRGQWRVYKAEFSDPLSVQAYSSTQLQAMIGGRLVINRESARWVLPSGGKTLRDAEAFFETCVRPTVRGVGDDYYEMLCNGKDQFAPGMTMMMDGSLVISWWDGVDLYLRKRR